MKWTIGLVTKFIGFIKLKLFSQDVCSNREKMIGVKNKAELIFLCLQMQSIKFRLIVFKVGLQYIQIFLCSRPINN